MAPGVRPRAAIIAMQPTAIASGIRASNTHQDVTAATAKIAAAAATSTKEKSRTPRPNLFSFPSPHDKDRAGSRDAAGAARVLGDGDPLGLDAARLLESCG